MVRARRHNTTLEYIERLNAKQEERRKEELQLENDKRTEIIMKLISDFDMLLNWLGTNADDDGLVLTLRQMSRHKDLVAVMRQDVGRPATDHNMFAKAMALKDWIKPHLAATEQKRSRQNWVKLGQRLAPSRFSEVALMAVDYSSMVRAAALDSSARKSGTASGKAGMRGSLDRVLHVMQKCNAQDEEEFEKES
jgi:hypothetical protein